MTLRWSRDLDEPPLPRPAEEPLPPNVRRFPLVIDPWTVFLMGRRQAERTREKAIARHKRQRVRR